MTIRIEAYDRLPDAARAIREQVFIRERDWRPEFDEWDAVSRASAGVRFERCAQSPRPVRAIGLVYSVRPARPESPRGDLPVLCGPRPSRPAGRYVIARLAVLTEAQGRHIGSRLLSDAERRIAQAGGTMAAVHSENDHYKFYEQRGYRLTDEVYEGGRHGWLVKDLSRNV